MLATKIVFDLHSLSVSRLVKIKQAFGNKHPALKRFRHFLQRCENIVSKVQGLPDGLFSNQKSQFG
jgi:hypothetical protein